MVELIPRLLPPFCYGNEPMTRPVGGIITHYASAIYQAPDRWDDIDTIWIQTLELNQPGDKRGVLLPRITDPSDPSFKPPGASYHVITSRAGDHYHLVPLTHPAWHAGRSYWQGFGSCNFWTLGHAFIAHKGSGYTEAQYVRGAELYAGWLKHFGLTIDQITGHENVRASYNERYPARKVADKHDPGLLFDWELFLDLIAKELGDAA